VYPALHVQVLWLQTPWPLQLCGQASERERECARAIDRMMMHQYAAISIEIERIFDLIPASTMGITTNEMNTNANKAPAIRDELHIEIDSHSRVWGCVCVCVWREVRAREGQQRNNENQNQRRVLDSSALSPTPTYFFRCLTASSGGLRETSVAVYRVWSAPLFCLAFSCRSR